MINLFASAPRASAVSALLWLVLGTGCVSVPVDRSVTGGRFADTALSPSSIKLFSWNIKKTTAPGWSDFVRKGEAARRFDGANLLLLQEACEPSVDEASSLARSLDDAVLGWVFAVSFDSRWLACGNDQATGVLTASSTRPLSVVPLLSQHRELGLTPKTSLATTYNIEGHTQTLLVINAHLLNFEWLTLDDYADQVAALGRAISQHDGPVIFAGDLNTRNRSRQAVVDRLVATAQLMPVFSAAAEGRTQAVVGGDLPLDHIYYRGLDIVRAGAVGSEASADLSDHNSLSVTFAVPEVRSRPINHN